MTPDQIREAAGALFQAEASGQQTGLLSRRYPGMTMVDAYAVQAVRGAQDGGGARARRLEDRADQPGHAERAEDRNPDSGVLLDDMMLESGARVP